MEKDIKSFAEFEYRERLFDRTYLGVPYWQALRFVVCEGALSDRLIHDNKVYKNKNFVQRNSLILKNFFLFFKSIGKQYNFDETELICFTHNKIKDKFFDYWKMPAQIKSTRIRTSFDPKDISTNEYNLLLIYFQANIKFRLKRKLNINKKDQNELRFLRNLEKKIKLNFGQSITAEEMEQYIYHYIEIYRVSEKYFEKLFNKTKCKAILVVCYYQEVLYAAYDVAKRKNILIMELQHGVINNHEEYWFEDLRGNNNLTPDYLLAFGKKHIEWTQLLPTTKAVSIGFPYQCFKIKELEYLSTEEKTVIIYPVAKKEFEIIINEFVSLAVPKGYRIIVKLHPNEVDGMKSRYPILSENSDIEFITRQSEGIYYWLKLGRHHVMASTTVGLEAVAFNHTNICIAENVPHEQTQPLMDWGIARGFSSANELMNLIQYPISTEYSEVRKALWENNAEKNIQKFLMDLRSNNWRR